jgi:DNA invertase Pin-like site-specific DNA recombinase
MLQPPVKPKDGKTVRVLGACRVSDPREGKQDERSNDDQGALLKEWLKTNLSVPYDLRLLKGQGRGELLDRSDFLELVELVQSGDYDLLITEDLGRILRRLHAHLFLEECQEYNTRVISIRERIDTAIDGWQDMSIISSWHHERSNRDTSYRIKRTNHNRFDSGGCAQFPISGYIKPTGSKTDLDWKKDPPFEEIFPRCGKMIENGASQAQIADMLNREGVPTGPFCRLSQWTSQMFGRVFRNPLLKGFRYRNKKKSRRNSRGKYECIAADPSETKWRKVPHLAFFEPEYYDYLVHLMDSRNPHKRNGQPDPRLGRRRIHIRFPGQLVFCGICGRLLVFGGTHGKRYLQCDGSRKHRCWNGVHIESESASKKLLAAMLHEIELLPEYDQAFLAQIQEEAKRADDEKSASVTTLTRELHELERQITNLVQALADGVESGNIKNRLKELEEQQLSMKHQITQLKTAQGDVISIPPLNTLKQLARDCLEELETSSWESQQAIRRMVPKIVVFPVQACDGGRVGLRAKFRFYPGNALDSDGQRELLGRLVHKTIVVDLFDYPQRVVFREQVMQLRAQGKTEREVAAVCGLTITAAQRAAGLHRLMEAKQLQDPYVEISQPPEEQNKLRRAKHPRYQFESLPDAGQF